jgi:hypothetical protein
MFCLSVDMICLYQRYDERVIQFRTLRQKISENFRRHCGHRQANGLNHLSRGQRPRSSIKAILGPVRANQIMSPSVPYAAIVTYLKRSYHFFDQRASTVATANYSEKSLGLPITHPPKLGMQFHHNRRYGRSRSRAMQSHEEISDSEGV